MSVISLLVVSALTAAPAVEDGTQLSFRGTMIAEKGDPGETTKKFDLTIVVGNVGDQGATLYWTVNEDGRGGWSWPNRFGNWAVNARLQGDPSTAPALLYDREQGLSIVPLVSPLFVADQPLEKGAKWNSGKLDYAVLGSEKRAGRDTWVVEASSPFGRKRTLWLDKESSAVVALDEVVFIGQGDQFEVLWELQESKRLSQSELKTVAGAFESLAKLRDELRIIPRVPNLSWKRDQLAMLKRELPAIAKSAAGSPLAPITGAAGSDTKDQKNRSNAVAALRKELLGGPAPDFKLDAIKGEPMTRDGLKGSVTVLHFWGYKDSPLQEPYGQVGYLDFLQRNRGEKGVKIFGVAVNEQLSNPSTRRRGITSAKKLQSFMNLSYPILIDDDTVIKKFGDPRVTGAKLPLSIVIDADGKIVHYHVGFYEVDRDRGLKELDDVITRALESRE